MRLGVNVLDETLEYGYDMQPLDINRKCIDDWRSIGLGIFGLADMFVALKQKYGDTNSIETVDKVFKFIFNTALDESCNRAEKYGTFGKYDWNKTKKSPLLAHCSQELYEKIEKHGLRNGTLVVIAPTGSLSLFMGRLSGGCEPLYKCFYERTSHAGEEKNIKFRVFSKSIEELLKYNNLPLSLSCEEIKQKFPWVIESHDINPMDRIKVQATMQKYVDVAISSTINLKENTTTKEIFDIYTEAWKQGLKGATCYVDNCKRGNILGVKENKETKENNKPIYNTIEPVNRRGIKEINGTTYRTKSACSKLYLTVNKTEEGDIFEVFVNPTNGCISNISTICRLVSMALRSGVKVESIIKELSEVKCSACQALIRKGEDIELSCGNAIATALKKSLGVKIQKETKGNIYEINKKDEDEGLMVCPQCGEKSLRREAKCYTCNICSFSRCE